MQKQPLVLAALIAACAATAGCLDNPHPPRVDLVIRGGLVVDGTGTPPRLLDLAIADGRIVALDAPGIARPARRVIDAGGRIVAPGFIDMHSHADLIVQSPAERQHELLAAKIRQGVTTIIVGNCGLGVAPATPAAAEILRDVNAWMTPDGVTGTAGSTGDFLDRLEADGVALNVGTLIPHGPVRVSTLALAAGEPDPEQLMEMRSAVRDGLAAGAFGLSCGLIYPPGMYSPTSELEALATEVAGADGLFTVHVRGSSETLLQATDELVAIARSSGARVHHSHMEAVGQRFWARIEQVLAIEDEARAESLSISHDVFLYTRAATMMVAIFPPWALEGGVASLLERLRDPDTRARIRQEVETRVPHWPPWRPGGWPHNLVEAVGWDGILVASLPAVADESWIGRSLEQIAAETDRDPFDVVADLMLEYDGRVGQQVAEISGSNDDDTALTAIFTHAASAVISDAEDYGRGAPHPAHAGAFARALRLARERDLMPLETVVHKMTGYPAGLLRLGDRGELRAGAAADVVIFDAATVADRATWDRPRQASSGVSWVLINGTAVVEHGAYRPGLSGRVLRAAAKESERSMDIRD